MGEVEAGQHRPALGIVEGDALAARERRPHRHAPGVGRRCSLAEQTVDPVEEQAARIARSADEHLARRRVRDDVVTGDRVFA